MYIARPPRSPVVASFVSSYWYCELDVRHDVEIVFPSAEGQLVIGLDPLAPTDLSTLVGPSTVAAQMDATQQRRAVGISLRMGAVSFLCDENTRDLVDTRVDLETIWGSEATKLTDRLRSMTVPGHMFDEFDATLLRRLDISRHVDHHVVAAEEAIRLGVPVGQVPALLQTDRRRLARSFTETIGFGLKSYSRLVRFREAVSRLREPSNTSVSMIAASLGYADQAHLTREVKEFSGVTPGVLRAQPSSSPHHLVVADPT